MKKKTEIVKWEIPKMPNEKALAKTRDSLVSQANSFVIKSEDHYVASWALVQLIDSAIATVEAPFDPFVSGLHRLHKMAIKLRDSLLDPLYGGKQRLMMLRYHFREEQEKLKAKADAAAAQALTKVQDKELEKQAKQAEKAGMPEVAAAVREQKGQVPLYFNTMPAVPKQEGSVLTERWMYEIEHPDLVEREYCCPDESIIGPLVRKLGDKVKISGLRIWLDKGEHSRKASA